MESKSIFLWWWHTVLDNVGDYASYYVVDSLTTEEIIYKDPRIRFKSCIKKLLMSLVSFRLAIALDCFSNYVKPWQRCLMAIGSILDFSNYKVINWGGGFREYSSIPRPGKYVAVRGLLSKDKIGNQSVAIGDPAIILPLITEGKYPNPQISNEYKKIALIPHFRDYEDFSRLYKNYKIIDIRTKDILKFIEEVRSCDCILSSSLHGIIIAHAYGIPALWVQKNYVDSGTFKYHDYFSSVNIPIYEGYTNISEILKSTDTIKSFFIEHKRESLPNADYEEMAVKLLQVAPFPLKQAYIDYINNYYTEKENS